MNELNNFFLGVQQVAQDAVDKAPYDRTFRGVIEEINDDGTCNVRINGRTYENIKLPQEYHFDYSQPWDGDLNVLGNFAIQNNTMVDYIVEQGKSGIWTYEKWNSGKAKCWGIVSGQIASASEFIQASYPFSFTAIENVQATGGWNDFSGSSYCAVIPTREPSKVVIRFYELRGGSVSGTVGASVYAIGTWK